MKLLWITPKWPLPAQDGARQATCQLLKALAAQGTEIHLLSYCEPEERVDAPAAIRELGLSSARAVPKASGSKIWNLVRNPLFALTLSPFRTPRLRAAVAEEILEHGNADAIVFDGLHAAAWLQAPGAALRFLPPLVYRAHNVETNLWIQTARAQRNPLLRAFVWLQARLIARFERELSTRCVHTAAVSQEDAQAFLAEYGAPRAACTPIGMPFLPVSAPARAPSESLRLLFLGKMDWRPNREGLEWFLREVWPSVAARRADATLTIAGAGASDWLAPYLPLPRVRFLGRVPEVEPLYRESHAALVPIFVGSGTRVKAIEASAHAVVCIGTELGVEGIGLDERTSYFRVESAQEWIDLLAILTPEQARRRGLSAWESLRHRYDPAPIATKLLESLS